MEITIEFWGWRPCGHQCSLLRQGICGACAEEAKNKKQKKQALEPAPVKK